MKKKIWLAIVAAILLLAVLAVVNRETVRVVGSNLFAPKSKLDDSKDWNGGKTYEKLYYSDISENTYLNLYVPDAEKPMPLLVLIHGGGFVFNDCESRQAQFMYRYFRDHGYACASVNYRLAQEEPFPGAIDDVEASIRFLKANAGEYGYDAERVAVWGESAGGYLALMAGAASDEDFHNVPFIGEEELTEPVTSEVQAVVNFYGAAGLGKKDSGFEELGIPEVVQWAAGLWLDKALKGTGYDYVESYWLRKDLGACTEEELYRISPDYYIDKNLDKEKSPHVLTWHGDADLDVPYIQSVRLQEKLEKAIGSDKTKLEIFHNYKHAADAFYSDENLVKVKEYLDKLFSE